MSVKYVVIDLSKIDGDKLGEMLSKAYEDGYKDGMNSVVAINAPTIPYNGDAWNSITGYTTTANSMTIDTSKSPLTSSSGVCIGSNLETHTITLANQTKVANSPD
jgi:hypothetical protein